MTDPQGARVVDIPMPEVIDGTGRHAPGNAAVDRSSVDVDRDVAYQQLKRSLDQTAEYGRALWQELSVVAAYLRDDIARAGGSTDASIRMSDEQWDRWKLVYAGALSLLAGPAGDSGYGAAEAQLEKQNQQARVRA